MADHRPAGRLGAGPVAAWRITGLQRSVRLRAGEDVVLVARDRSALLGQRVLAAESVGIGMQIGPRLRDHPALRIHPRPLADAIARVDRRLAGRSGGAQIRAPRAVPGSRGRGKCLTLLIRAGESTEIGPVARAGARDEKTHLILLR